jgi:DNA mismatch repair ATPase MutS
MKTYLLFADHDLPADPQLPWNADALIDDVELRPLIYAMADGDKFLAETAQRLLLESLTSIEEIRYRQDVLRDCIAQEPIVRELYDLAVDAITREKKIFGWMSTRSPAAVLQHALEALELFASILRTLRTIAEEHRAQFTSAGFDRFFEMTLHELDDDYFAEIGRHLRRLRLRDGVRISARLDHGGKSTDLVLRRTAQDRPSLGERINAFTHQPPSFRIAERDEAGANALTDMRGRGINLVADALARSTDHILSFFAMMRLELGFYVGCLNLRNRLEPQGYPLEFPEPSPPEDDSFTTTGLYDVSLALVNPDQVNGNDIAADRKTLIIVTGANRGGKSTFLRSLGLAQLMMQAGMFAPANTLRLSVVSGVATHFKREEDATMTSGKFDEELVRMRDIVDHIAPRSLVLFNESFAATNEREGSEIARRVILALRESHIRVIFVTHQYALAHPFVGDDGVEFLRAGRDRSFKLEEREPLPTSFGDDLYQRIFGAGPHVEAGLIQTR